MNIFTRVWLWLLIISIIFFIVFIIYFEMSAYKNTSDGKISIPFWVWVLFGLAVLFLLIAIILYIIDWNTYRENIENAKACGTYVEPKRECKPVCKPEIKKECKSEMRKECGKIVGSDGYSYMKDENNNFFAKDINGNTYMRDSNNNIIVKDVNGKQVKNIAGEQINRSLNLQTNPLMTNNLQTNVPMTNNLQTNLPMANNLPSLPNVVQSNSPRLLDNVNRLQTSNSIRNNIPVTRTVNNVPNTLNQLSNNPDALTRFLG